MIKFLKSISKDQLNEWVEQAKEKAHLGKLPKYIPLLGQADPDEFIFSIHTFDDYHFSHGNLSKTFSFMSVNKVFLLLYLLSQLGDEFILERVGAEASNYPFNSLTQLQLDQGFPRNPMINSGAITLAGLLGENTLDGCEQLRLWLNQCSGSQLFLDEDMLESVRSLPNPKNQALVDELFKTGAITNPENALDTYQKICCLSGNITDLANLGMMLIQCSKIQDKTRQIVQDIMLNCGLYEDSKTFASKTGFPSKSGVSGAMLSIVPQQGIIACYSPPLDEKGNSVAGVFLIEKIAEFLNG